MLNNSDKARNILVSIVLAMMLCNVSGIAVYLHLHSDTAHHHNSSDRNGDKDCPICQQAVFGGKYYNTVAVVCPLIPETAAVPFLDPSFYVLANHWTASFKIRPPPSISFC